MRSRWLLLVAIAALAGPGSRPAPAGEVDPADHRVVINKFTFMPERLEMRPGERVEWVNRDIAPHTASGQNGEWDTQELAQGQTAVIRFDAPGTFPYFCFYHPNMRGEVVVIED